VGYTEAKREAASGGAARESAAVARRLRAQQKFYQAVLGLLVVCGLGAGLYWWVQRPVSSHLDADGFSFDVCYPPGDLPLLRIWQSAVPGSIAVEYRNDGAQPRYIEQEFKVEAQSLESTGEYAWPQPMGELTVLSWPRGRVMCSVMLDPAAGSGQLVMRVRQLPPLVNGTNPGLAAPLQNMYFATARVPSPEMAASEGKSFIELYKDEQGGGAWDLAECQAGQARGHERRVDSFSMYGHMWLDGALTLALVTDDARLLAHDYAQHDFAEQPALAPLAKLLRQHGAPQSEFWLADGFALRTTPQQERLLVAADGKLHPIRSLSPVLQSPDGSYKT
jgi:hypothetical protein